MNSVNQNNTGGNPPDSDSEKTIPLMGGVVQPGDAGLPGEAGGKASSKLLNQGTLLILIVAGLAAGSLYLMRVTHANLESIETDKEITAKIEQVITRITNPQGMAPDDPLRNENIKNTFEDTQSLERIVKADPSQHQVPPEFIKKNPFLEQETAKVIQPDLTQNTAPVNTDQQKNQKKIQLEFKSLKLETVIEGRTPMAIINGKIVKPGQQFGSFTIKSINGLSVELEAEGQTYTLAMKSGQDSSTKKK